MLNSKDFDLWADGYDRSVNIAEDADEYPFAGYKQVLGFIYNAVRSGGCRSVLDIGFGTGTLTQKLYNDGCEVFGIDFSAGMIEIAKAKMPSAVLMQHDFVTGLPDCFAAQRFDCIISTYAIHHLTNAGKVTFIKELLEHLSPRGKILLGDVAFETRSELESCKKSSGDRWDDDEIYMVLDELKEAFPNALLHKLSHCAGVVEITPCAL